MWSCPPPPEFSQPIPNKNNCKLRPQIRENFLFGRRVKIQFRGGGQIHVVSRILFDRFRTHRKLKSLDFVNHPEKLQFIYVC